MQTVRFIFIWDYRRSFRTGTDCLKEAVPQKQGRLNAGMMKIKEVES